MSPHVRHFERSSPTLFFPPRSCGAVGLRSEKSLFLFPRICRHTSHHHRAHLSNELAARHACHFERSKPTLSSRFAPANRSACVVRNLSSSSSLQRPIPLVALRKSQS